MLQNVAMACFLALLSASCSDVTNDDILPDGKYPMTFTAAVDGMAVSRATTAADGKTSWQENDLVAISKDGGTGYKEYKITEVSGGAMSPVADALYWNQTTETLGAWHPVSCIIGNGGSSGEVNITDQSGGFGTLENILYAPAANYTYSSGSPVDFTFRHALAKVSVMLQKESGKTDFTDEEISDAEVTFMGYTAGSLGYDGLAGDGENGEIKPKKETTDGTTTYTALLVPQQMQNVKFIKVTIGTGAAARDYYYTPAGDNDANLTAGKQYTYNITVKKEGLQVESVSASWDDETSEEEAVGATFKVHLADFTAPANTSGYKVTNADGEELTAEGGAYSVSDEIIISLSANENYRLKNFLTGVDAGICKQKVDYVADTRTYTYTFYDMRSDLWLDNIQAEAEDVSTTLSTPKAGDYYYADETWSSTLEKPCIGIVFKVGAGTDDAASNYTGLKDNTIHGYVVAVNDAHTDVGAWGIREVDVEGIENNGSAGNKYDGYKNTAIICQLDAYAATDVSQPMKNGQYWAFKVASEYATTAPEQTSGWYLPSIQQLADIYSLSDLATRLTAAGGTDFKRTENDGRYWSATEKNGYDAWFYRFAKGNSGSYAKSNDGGDYLSSSKSYVRAILTF